MQAVGTVSLTCYGIVWGFNPLKTFANKARHRPRVPRRYPKATLP